VVAKAPQITHRWGFHSGSLADTFNGGTSAGLFGNASVTNDVLLLVTNGDGSKVPMTFAKLPADLISGYDKLTIEIWANVASAPSGSAHLFDFGNPLEATGGSTGVGAYLLGNPIKGASSLFLIGDTTAGTGNGRASAQWQPLGSVSGQQTAQFGTTAGHIPPVNRHYVVTLDIANTNMSLYTNGVLANSLTIAPFTTTGNGITVTNAIQVPGIIDNASFLGRSQNTGDGLVNGSIDEFRIWYGALNAADVANSFSLGPNQAKLFITNLGTGNFTVAWTNTAITAPFVLQTNSSLTNPAGWATWAGAGPAVAGGFKQITASTAGGPLFFRLIEP
jgi:hypothetical protein